MSLLTRMERVNRMHDLIQYKRTGPPNCFARKMGLSQSMLYLLIKELKQMGAPIMYCKYRESYKYQYPVEFKFGFETMDTQETQQVTGGIIKASQTHFNYIWKAVNFNSISK